MQVDIQLEVRSDPKLMRSIRGLVKSYVCQSGFGEDKADEVVLAIDEACTNAIRHSYQGEQDKVIALQVVSEDAYIEFEVRDSGQSAPPENLMRKELEAPNPEDLKPHGLGVQLIYEVFDEVVFWPGEEEGNCVVMRLNLPK